MVPLALNASHSCGSMSVEGYGVAIIDGYAFGFVAVGLMFHVIQLFYRLLFKYIPIIAWLCFIPAERALMANVFNLPETKAMLRYVDN